MAVTKSIHINGKKPFEHEILIFITNQNGEWYSKFIDQEEVKNLCACIKSTLTILRTSNIQIDLWRNQLAIVVIRSFFFRSFECKLQIEFNNANWKKSLNKREIGIINESRFAIDQF